MGCGPSRDPEEVVVDQRPRTYTMPSPPQRERQQTIQSSPRHSKGFRPVDERIYMVTHPRSMKINYQAIGKQRTDSGGSYAEQVADLQHVIARQVRRSSFDPEMAYELVNKSRAILPATPEPLESLTADEYVTSASLTSCSLSERSVSPLRSESSYTRSEQSPFSKSEQSVVETERSVRIKVAKATIHHDNIQYTNGLLSPTSRFPQMTPTPQSQLKTVSPVGVVLPAITSAVPSIRIQTPSPPTKPAPSGPRPDTPRKMTYVCRPVKRSTQLKISSNASPCENASLHAAGGSGDFGGGGGDALDLPLSNETPCQEPPCQEPPCQDSPCPESPCAEPPCPESLCAECPCQVTSSCDVCPRPPGPPRQLNKIVSKPLPVWQKDSFLQRAPVLPGISQHNPVITKDPTSLVVTDLTCMVDGKFIYTGRDNQLAESCVMHRNFFDGEMRQRGPDDHNEDIVSPGVEPDIRELAEVTETQKAEYNIAMPPFELQPVELVINLEDEDSKVPKQRVPLIAPQSIHTPLVKLIDGDRALYDDKTQFVDGKPINEGEEAGVPPASTDDVEAVHVSQAKHEIVEHDVDEVSDPGYIAERMVFGLEATPLRNSGVFDIVPVEMPSVTQSLSISTLPDEEPEHAVVLYAEKPPSPVKEDCGCDDPCEDPCEDSCGDQFNMSVEIKMTTPRCGPRRRSRSMSPKIRVRATSISPDCSSCPRKDHNSRLGQQETTREVAIPVEVTIRDIVKAPSEPSDDGDTEQPETTS